MNDIQKAASRYNDRCDNFTRMVVSQKPMVRRRVVKQLIEDAVKRDAEPTNLIAALLRGLRGAETCPQQRRYFDLCEEVLSNASREINTRWLAELTASQEQK